MEQYLYDWITKAEEDLTVIKRLTEDDIYAHSAVCFHCQQLAEKYLKLYLLKQGDELKKTHNIEFLLEKCSEFDSDFSAIDPMNLSDYGVQIRYPDDMYVPDDEEVLVYKELAISIRNMVRLKMGL